MSRALGPRCLSPVEASAFLLNALRADAEAALSESVTSCVVAVPACFNDLQQTSAARRRDELLDLPVHFRAGARG